MVGNVWQSAGNAVWKRPLPTSRRQCRAIPGLGAGGGREQTPCRPIKVARNPLQAHYRGILILNKQASERPLASKPGNLQMELEQEKKPPLPFPSSLWLSIHCSPPPRARRRPLKHTKVASWGIEPAAAAFCPATAHPSARALPPDHLCSLSRRWEPSAALPSDSSRPHRTAPFFLPRLAAAAAAAAARRGRNPDVDSSCRSWRTPPVPISPLGQMKLSPPSPPL